VWQHSTAVTNKVCLFSHNAAVLLDNDNKSPDSPACLPPKWAAETPHKNEFTLGTVSHRRSLARDSQKYPHTEDSVDFMQRYLARRCHFRREVSATYDRTGTMTNLTATSGEELGGRNMQRFILRKALEILWINVIFSCEAVVAVSADCVGSDWEHFVCVSVYFPHI